MGSSVAVLLSCCLLLLLLLSCVLVLLINCFLPRLLSLLDAARPRIRDDATLGGRPGLRCRRPP